MGTPIYRLSRSTAIKNWSIRFRSQGKAPKTSNSTTTINSNVAGLSNKCVDVPPQPVGPGAAKDKEYKNPEYFCYHTDSFAEAFVEMAEYRLPPPNNKEKYTRNL